MGVGQVVRWFDHVRNAIQYLILNLNAYVVWHVISGQLEIFGFDFYVIGLQYSLNPQHIDLGGGLTLCSGKPASRSIAVFLDPSINVVGYCYIVNDWVRLHDTDDWLG